MTPQDQPAPRPVARPASRWRDVLRGLLLLAAVALGILTVARDVDGFVGSLASVGIGGVAVSFLFALLGIVCSSRAWRLNVASIAGVIAPSDARRVFFVSQLGKYLPGSVWPVLAQMDAARRYGLSGSYMAVSALLFLVLHLLTGLLVVVAVVPWAAPELLREYPWVLGLVPVVVVAFAPGILSRVIDRVLSRVRKPPLPRRLDHRDVVFPSAWLMVTWGCYAVSAVAIAAPVAGDGLSATLGLATAGGFALAWIVGVSVVPAPAGIGAREVVLVLALSPLLGVIGATSVAIVLRVVHTVADLVLAGVGLVAGRAG